MCVYTIMVLIDSPLHLFVCFKVCQGITETLGDNLQLSKSVTSYVTECDPHWRVSESMEHNAQTRGEILTNFSSIRFMSLSRHNTNYSLTQKEQPMYSSPDTLRNLWDHKMLPHYSTPA